MKTYNHSTESFTELVFENRNKNYGAYVIRKSYNNTLSKALLLTCGILVLLVLISVLFTKNTPAKIDITGNIPVIEKLFSVPVDLTPKKKEDVVEKKTPETVKPKTDNLNVEVKDKKTEDKIKTNDNTVTVKDGDTKGKDSVGEHKIPDVVTNTTDKGKEDKVIDIADEMPEFKGDLFNYLRKNLTYPRMAIEAGTSGTVYLSFVVEKDGSINEIKVLRPVENGCTEEAVRVVKSMPKWKPGKNHGEAARVQFNLPVKFKIY